MHRVEGRSLCENGVQVESRESKGPAWLSRVGISAWRAIAKAERKASDCSVEQS